MKRSRASIRYAKALIAAAVEREGALKAVHGDLITIAQTLSNHPKLVRVLESPVAGASVKRAYLNEVFTNPQPLTAGLLDALTKNERLALLQDIAIRFERMYNDLQGFVVATLKSSHTTSPAFDQELTDKILAAGYKQVVLEKQVSPELLGGFILRVKDLQFDASLSTQVDRLKREFSNNL
ncbi:MAG: ATP synthase F1 subunit delta [Bacteroidetes bacterium]|nr:ATP synthase F1 subunit delta [Bacteroidota bacterium]MDA0843159.1 ATP synthase F1 subunit delta [Bacteroidota bacterium]MDA1148599.1 ATP synthase F1 subunit delta [Bacteroidota bacterium]